MAMVEIFPNYAARLVWATTYSSEQSVLDLVASKTTLNKLGINTSGRLGYISTGDTDRWCSRF